MREEHSRSQEELEWGRRLCPRGPSVPSVLCDSVWHRVEKGQGRWRAGPVGAGCALAVEASRAALGSLTFSLRVFAVLGVAERGSR